MRNRYVLMLDLPAIAIAAYGAFALRFDWFFYQYRSEFLPFLVAALLVKPVFLYMFGMYERYWMYASVPDLIALVTAVSAAELVLTTIVTIGLITHRLPEFPRSALLIDYLLTLAATGGIRISIRVVAESGQSIRRPRPDRHALIAGAGRAGMMVAREIQRNPQLRLNVIGFLDDDRAKMRKRVLGLPVLGPTSAAGHVAEMRRADEIIIAMPTAPGEVLRRIANSASAAGIPSRTIPGVFELLDGHVSVRMLRNVEISDLLRREQVVASPQTATYLAGTTVLVTGAGGSIGFELCRQVAHARPKRLIMLGHGENSIFSADRELRDAYPSVPVSTVIADIRDSVRLEHVFSEYGAEIVFHAAAHKHVPLMQDNPEEAITNNVVGTRNIVEAALRAGVQRLVMISSDKAVAPSSLMGASKRVAELIVRDRAARSGRALSVVRFGNVLGSRGSVVSLFKQQIERGGPITVTHPDMKRFFMTIPEAVHLVLQAGGLSRGGELFVLRMGDPVLITDLARDLIRLSGFTEEDIPIVFTGVRGGEKLEESLLDIGEEATATAHPDVLRVENGNAHPLDLDAALATLESAARCGNRGAIEAALAQLIPTFASTGVQS